MLRRSASWFVARAVAEDADRLLRGHGVDALLMARHAVRVAGERDRGCHWTRVLAEVETRIRYRPW